MKQKGPNYAAAFLSIVDFLKISRFHHHFRISLFSSTNANVSFICFQLARLLPCSRTILCECLYRRIIQYSKCVKYTKSISKWSFVGTKIVGYNCGNGYGYACFTDYVSALHPNRSVSRDRREVRFSLSMTFFLHLLYFNVIILLITIIIFLEIR